IYLPSCKPVTINLDILGCHRLNVTWYDPRTGQTRPDSDIPGSGTREFTPPAIWPDWVLVLDDPERHYPPPGMRVYVD
ncbi:MAG: putative collagen-binding domain-containing protein, partial [Anaerolineae bacterium]|nr:putative collagen-binding domain-containing protein [Anaerolineae bacterium]